MRSRLVPGVVAALTICATAVAATNSDGTAAIKLSTKKTNAPASMIVGGLFAPDASGAQRVLTAVTVILPPGTRLNKGGLTLCPGDEQSLGKLKGAAEKNCPADSQIGTGTAAVLLGSLATTLGITIWNQEAGPTLQLNIGSTPTFMTHGTLQGNRLTFPLPIAERVSAKIKAFQLTFDKASYLTTPATCPRSQRWKGGLAAAVSGGGAISIPASWGCKR